MIPAIIMYWAMLERINGWKIAETGLLSRMARRRFRLETRNQKLETRLQPQTAPHIGEAIWTIAVGEGRRGA